VRNDKRAPLLLLVFCVLLPLCGFFALAFLVATGQGLWFDLPLLAAVHSVASPTLDRIFEAASALGYNGALLVGLCLAVTLSTNRHFRQACFVSFSFAGSLLLSMITKHQVGRMRPDLWHGLSNDGYSFPSSHAVASMTLVAVLMLLTLDQRTYRQWLAPVRVLIALLGPTFVIVVGISRIYLGAHYPSDVAAGWLLGMAWVVGLMSIFHLNQKGPTIS
jgi:membrane-associated phospholipid phosphatase